MKNKGNEQSPIQQLREIRDKISADIQDMDFEQLQKYVEKHSTIHSASVWPKVK